VRLYVDLGEIDPSNREAFLRENTQELIATAQRVLRP
jgi:phenol 2-monooxygenase (NADPH)